MVNSNNWLKYGAIVLGSIFTLNLLARNNEDKAINNVTGDSLQASNIAKKIAEQLGTRIKVFGFALFPWENESGVIKLIKDNAGLWESIKKQYPTWSGGSGLVKDLVDYLSKDDLAEIKHIIV